jgi:hypothetical protein
MRLPRCPTFLFAASSKASSLSVLVMSSGMCDCNVKSCLLINELLLSNSSVCTLNARNVTWASRSCGNRIVLGTEMKKHNLNNSKNNNTIVAAAATVMAFLTLAAPLLLLLLSQPVEGWIDRIIDDAPVAASGENVYVVWSNNQSEIMFRASNDNGATFSDKINLSNSAEFSSAHPDVIASENNVYVSFHDNRTGNVDTYVRASTDGGQTFGDVIRINGTGTMPQKTKLVVNPLLHPLQDSEENTMIAASGENVYVVSWDKKTGNWEVFLARSTDNGETFEDTINLSNTTDAKSDSAMIEADGENVYVTWWEMTSQEQPRVPVMRVSNDNGETFGPVLMLAANGTIGSGEAEEIGVVGEEEGGGGG